jgi:hypothetical protein
MGFGVLVATSPKSPSTPQAHQPANPYLIWIVFSSELPFSVCCWNSYFREHMTRLYSTSLKFLAYPVLKIPETPCGIVNCACVPLMYCVPDVMDSGFNTNPDPGSTNPDPGSTNSYLPRMNTDALYTHLTFSKPTPCDDVKVNFKSDISVARDLMIRQIPASPVPSLTASNVLITQMFS